MKFNGLTKQGQEYLAKIQAEQSSIIFKKIVIGDGILDEHDDPSELTRIINLKKEVGILDIVQKKDVVTLITNIDNIGLQQGYFPREIGIVVNDRGTEKLYYYMNDGTETSWIPPESYGPFKIELKLNIIASNAESIVAKGQHAIYVTKEYLELNTLKKNEIEQLLGFNAIKKEFTLATLDDIRNLFPGSTRTSGAFDLGHITNDSTRMINMMLLSNYNEYLQQKILEIKGFFNNLNSRKVDKTELNNYYTKQEINSKVGTLESNKADKTELNNYYTKQEINSKVSTLESNKADKTTLNNYYTKQEINSKVGTLESNKADKTTLNNYYTKNTTYTKYEVNEKLNKKADSETVANSLNNKANKTIKVTVGTGLLGGGTLENNISIAVDKLNTNEIQNILSDWR